MLRFIKTSLGTQVLQDRSIALNAKQRRLLLLIDSNDFKTMRPELSAKIATPELVQQLIEFGLIYNLDHPQQQTNSAESGIEAPLAFETTESQQSDTTKEIITPSPLVMADAEHLDFKTLDFEQIKAFMKNSLQQYCGLMAKQLMIKIEQANSIEELQRCRMQWLTYLQESKIQPKTLNFYLQQINHTIQQLQAEYA